MSTGECGAASIAERYQREVERRVDAFYRDLIALGETPPARRFALEGFLEAGIALELASREALSELVRSCFERYFGEPPPEQPEAAAGEPPPAGVAVPVRWQRAPVFPS